MRVHAARIGGDRIVDLPVDHFERLAQADRFGLHELTEHPEEADVILFTQCHMVDWRLRAIREHPLARKYWNRVMVYDERDATWQSFPGIYVGTKYASFDPDYQRPWGYLKIPELGSVVREPDLLFSFVASNTAPCRSSLFGLRHQRGVVEEVSNFMFWNESSPEYFQKRARYHETLARSRFVLCPRGRGTSSIRLYETLAAGRVPVIISDHWVEPPGPDWSAFSIRWPEGRIDGLLDLLEECEETWPTMSATASTAYAEHFAEPVAFHRTVELCLELHAIDARPPARRMMRFQALTASAAARLPPAGRSLFLGDRKLPKMGDRQGVAICRR